MTPESQRVALAEWAGWTNIFTAHGDLYGDRPHNPLYGLQVLVPDYLNSLDQVHELEERLTENEQFDYFHALNDAVGLVQPYSPAWIKEPACFTLLHATAAQRCEALLRTIGKWEEE